MMMVLSDTTAWKAAEMSERIRLEISEMAVLELSEDGPIVTLSLGISLSLFTMNRLKNTNENNPHNGTLLFLGYADMPPSESCR